MAKKVTTKKTVNKPVNKKKPTEKKTVVINKKNDIMEKNDIKEKIEFLTSDLDEITTEKKEIVETPEVKIPQSKSDKTQVQWLEEQIDGLRLENEKYESKYLEMKSKYEQMAKQPVKEINNKQTDLQLKKSVIDIYNELLGNYNGKNGQKWTTVRIDYMLKKFKTKFNFI